MSSSLYTLAALFYIIVLPWAMWRIGGLRSIVPLAVVQIGLGIVLGPIGLGALFPSVYSAFLSPVRNVIDGISELAIIFFALSTGMHIEWSNYQARRLSFVFVGICCVGAPFLLGVCAASWIWKNYPVVVIGANGGELGFVLGTATALSVTALPVLGAILRDLDMIRHPIGQWGLGLAALNDAALWLLMSGILSLFSVGSDTSFTLLTPVYLWIMYGVLRPAFHRFSISNQRLSTESLLIWVVAITLGSAFATEFLGLHHLLGAFITGTILPAQVRERIIEQIDQSVVLILTPFFFISTGLKASFDNNFDEITGIVMVVTISAIVGKFIGTTFPARLVGFGWRQSLALGALMQTKGMMELAVLAILLNAGLISQLVFSALTLMALITTAVAMPLTRIILRTDEQGSAGNNSNHS